MMNEIRQKRSTAQTKRKKKDSRQNTRNNEGSKPKLEMPKYDRAFEEEFEKNYKKDIDKFIDGSDFEVESLGGFSEISKGTFKSVMQNPRMKGLEKVYLQRLEFQQLGQKKKSRPKPAVKREFLDRFCDDPQFIAKGEQLKLDIGANNTQTGSSGKKRPNMGSPYQEPPAQQTANRSNSSLVNESGLVQTSHMMPMQTPEKFKIALQESATSAQPPSSSARKNSQTN